MKKPFLLFFVFCLFGTAIATEPNYPAYTGLVNDYAGVIDPATAHKIEKLCRTLEEKTSAELAVAVVKTVAPLDPKEYAVKLFEKWKIGKKGKDNGLLILLAMDERRVEVEVGYGLEGVINDARAGAILDQYVIPFFKEGKFGEGLYNGAAAIAEEIAKAAKQELPEEYRAKKPAFDGSMLIIIGAVVLVVMLSLFATGLASGLMGAVIGAILGLIWAGVIGAVVGALVGFMLSYTKFPGSGSFGGGWGGGGWGGGGGGGGFGFGGGGSGGGGAGRSW